MKLFKENTCEEGRHIIYENGKYTSIPYYHHASPCYPSYTDRTDAYYYKYNKPKSSVQTYISTIEAYNYDRIRCSHIKSFFQVISEIKEFKKSKGILSEDLMNDLRDGYPNYLPWTYTGTIMVSLYD